MSTAPAAQPPAPRHAGGMAIGALSRRTAVKVPTIRYYEEIGLLPTPPRGGNGRRLYGEAAVDRLGFIRRARDLGFGIDDIRALLDMSDRPGQPCADIDRIARQHRDAVRDKIRQLASLEAALTAMVDQCGHGAVADCQILEALGRD